MNRVVCSEMDRSEVVEKIVSLVESYAHSMGCECEGRRGGSVKAPHYTLCWWHTAGEVLADVCEALGIREEEVPDFKLRRVE